MMERKAAIVLVLPDGTVLGRLPPVPVATPWWQDIEPVVAAARALWHRHHGVARERMRGIGTLVELGLPDYRGPALSATIGNAFERAADMLLPDDRAILVPFIAGLPERFARLAECGIGDTLIHGDFHPGNFRGGGARLALLDWGDSGVGHPLLDQPAFLSRVPADTVAPVRMHWIAAWTKHVPGSDPKRAEILLAPVAAARQAAIYQRFLDSIEPSEQAYHRGDPKTWLERAATLLRQARG